MTNRKPVSVPSNNWIDAQRVDVDDMNTEQSRNVQIDAAIINNHFGSGVLPDSIEQKVLFDTDNLSQEQAALIVSGDFDGTGMTPTEQPTDSLLGEQLEVELTGADVYGRFSTKVVIIGLDFQGNTQYDRFEFYRNEKQVTKKHYARILTILFNDFKGNNNCSNYRGGRVVIREVQSFQLSRDALAVAQDLEPNLFFRDFNVSGLVSQSLYFSLQDAIGSEYTVDSLNIQTTVKQNRLLEAGDVVTKIGEKFKATTNNIQKISLLLGVQADDSVPIQNKFDWSGDLVISVYALQTSVSCPTTIVPQLDIEFDPTAEPIAQLSLDQADFRDQGYVLTDVLQPIDFVFSDTKLASIASKAIVPGKYYVFTISRSGAANTGNIFTGVGNSSIEDSRLTLFNTAWVDVPEEQLWFRVFSDAAKVSDGQAYDSGNGIEIEKTVENQLGATVDYCLDHQNFADTGENILNTAVVQADTYDYKEEQDERTGNPVFSRQKFVPSFSFVNQSGLATLKEVGEPLVIGCAKDINPKRNPILNKTQNVPGLVRNDLFRVLNPDADLLSNNLLGSTLIPNSLSSSVKYKIARVKYCTDGYGDVNGDGEITSTDVARATELVGESLLLATTQIKIANGEIDTLELIRADVDGDGYITSADVNLISDFVTRDINSFPVGTYFTHLEIQVQQHIGRYDGYHNCNDGYVKVNGTSGNKVDASLLTSYEKEYYGFVETPDMNGTDPVFDTVPFSSVNFDINPLPFWQDYLLAISSDAKFVMAAFSFDSSVDEESCDEATTGICTDRIDINLSADPGRNDIMLPDNLIMRHGQILNPDGSHYKVDLEINHVILELPAVPLQDAIIDVFRKLVADAGDGFTSAGYPAMRFSDCSTVKTDAMARGQIKFGVAVQAFNPNLDGYTSEDGYGIIADELIGVHMDQVNGLLTLTIKDLDVDPIYLTLVTKIEITVYMKKAGWNNNTLVVPPEQIVGLLS